MIAMLLSLADVVVVCWSANERRITLMFVTPPLSILRFAEEVKQFKAHRLIKAGSADITPAYEEVSISTHKNGSHSCYETREGHNTHPTQYKPEASDLAKT